MVQRDAVIYSDVRARQQGGRERDWSRLPASLAINASERNEHGHMDMITRTILQQCTPELRLIFFFHLVSSACPAFILSVVYALPKDSQLRME
jgi:hypothetical protein